MDLMNYIIFAMSLFGIALSAFLAIKRQWEHDDWTYLTWYANLTLFFLMRSFWDIPAPTRGLWNKAIFFHILGITIINRIVRYLKPIK